MKTSDLKYLLAYITPFTGWISLAYDGWWSWTAVIFMFGVVPVVDALLPTDDHNHTPSAEEGRSSSRVFDLLLYLNLPILYALFIGFFVLASQGDMATADLVGKMLSIGFIGGAIGINVAHEIGHRPEWYNQWVSRLLLLPELYMHFNIEHNRGHHKWVSTPHDPASSRYGESVYRFWLRTVSGSFISACRIERDDAKRHGYAVWSLKNKMVLFIIIQLGYLLFVGLVFGWAIVPLAICMAVAGFTLLEVVNYIEHYGLTRQKLASGRYEPVQPHHSWNSDHYFGRILLYELTRHSDHHYKSSRKYQVLRHLDESPQMPLGYPASMLMSLLPPLWFSVMHRHPALQTAS